MKTTTEEIWPLTQLGVERPSRHRLGDVQALAASMALEGLRHPILLAPNGQVLKGTRRLAAAKLLGWSAIQARVVSYVEDAVEAIVAQRDEHSLPRTTTEGVDLGMTIETLDHRFVGTGANPYDAYTHVYPAVTSSSTMYKRAKTVVVASRSATAYPHVRDAAKECLAGIEAGTLTVTAAYKVVRAAEAADPVDGLGADGLPIIAPPVSTARSPKARKLRVDWIRAMAAQAATTEQIAARLGISVQGLRKIVNAEGIHIHADKVLNRTIRKAADPNRAVSVAIADLDALVWSLEKVDPADLDPNEAAGWAAQLREYARAIDRVSRKIVKEHVQ